jgi:hypothetical protein
MRHFISPPTLHQVDQLGSNLQEHGFVVLQAKDMCALAGVAVGMLNAWTPYWDDLPVDTYLRDGGHYRRRRHSCFVVNGQEIVQVAHRPHWQPLDYNALHGGMYRNFEPMPPAWVQQAAWPLLLQWLGSVCTELKGRNTWHVEAHPFRIDTTDGIGRPTPEGAHRDGVDLVAVFLVERHGVKGGETRVFDANGPYGQRFTLTQAWSVLLLDDAKVVHESTPIQPLDGAGHRDTLVITLRANGFQDDGIP